MFLAIMDVKLNGSPKNTMQYRTFGKDKRKVSILGFGCMRLPTDTGAMTGVVDEKEAARIIHYGIDHGINYLDTAWVYHRGKCEAILGRILKNGYREKVSIATKLPTWEIKSVKDADRVFDTQRKNLKTDKIDVYLIHNLQRSFRDIFLNNRLADWAWKKKEKGEVDYVGFSFHDDYVFFTEIVDSFDRWDFCQLQYNYVGEAAQATTRGLDYAAKKGLSMIVMEPLFGGALAKPTGKMGQLFKEGEGKKYNPVDLALRWLWNRPDVAIVLSGMSSFEQVKQNIEIAEKATVGGLTAEEKAFIGKLQKVYDESQPIKCTKCDYCKKDCPAGVDIPFNFEFYNNHVASGAGDKKPVNSGDTPLYKSLYISMEPTQRADHCTDCGNCETICPQKLPIRKLLAKAHKVLGG
jgi:predicted aldo/keto reductase-like oxidoreductase